MAQPSLQSSIFPKKSQSQLIEEIIRRHPNVRNEDEKGPLLIIEEIDENSFSSIYEQFQVAKNQQMTKDEIRRCLKSYSKELTYDDNDFEVVFLKMDSNHDEKISWDEFLDYLLLEYKEKNIDDAGDPNIFPEPSITEPPIFFKSHHRHPIIRIAFNPAVTKECVGSFSCGKYITLSHDGVIHTWSLNMNLERTWISVSPVLRASQAWLTDLVCLPDVNVICTSSSARDLRFYDVTADEFALRMMISSMDEAAISLCYQFYTDIRKDSVLIAGDMGGSLKVFLFNRASSGPFKQKPGFDYTINRYAEVMKGGVEGMNVQEIHGLHDDWVRQIGYYKSLNFIVSCSLTSKKSLVLSEFFYLNPKHIFNVKRGISCFAIDESSHIIVTGGPDCIIRVWYTFVTNQPLATYKGHGASIVAVVPQLKDFRIYSISTDRVIKVWDHKRKQCIQTFSEKLFEIGSTTPMTAIYNDMARMLVIGSLKIAMVRFGSEVNEHYTDGFTHSKTVTKALYNPVFKCLITVGMDSCIMTWKPLTGKKISLIQNAHIVQIHGEIQSVGITTAVFDPQKMTLLTGALDGSIKMWNLNAGICLRNMSIENECAVTNLIWISLRIFGFGWNKKVTEWEDSIEAGKSKVWKGCSDVDIATLCWPISIAACSNEGFLNLYRLETGQSYKKYPLKDIDQRIQNQPRKTSSIEPASASNREKPVEKICRKLSEIVLPYGGKRTAVQSMLHLDARTISPDVGTLLLALENGWIQLWSPHPIGGLISYFYAIHVVADYVITMASDIKNEYLFTGHTAGYVKVWLLNDFGLPKSHRKICMPLLRLKFPFLIKQKFDGRAKRSVRGQPNPMLLSSHRAHVTSLTHIELIEDSEILVSCGVDHSVRLWTYGGQYIGTLGMEKPWINLSPNKPVQIDSFSIPPDLKRVASSTSLKVLTNGWAPNKKKITETEAEVRFRKLLEKREVQHKAYGKSVETPILGKFFQMPLLTSKIIKEPKIDMTTKPKARILCHMNIHNISTVVYPKITETIGQGRRNQEKSEQQQEKKLSRPNKIKKKVAMEN